MKDKAWLSWESDLCNSKVVGENDSQATLCYPAMSESFTQVYTPEQLQDSSLYGKLSKVKVENCREFQTYTEINSGNYQQIISRRKTFGNSTWLPTVQNS